MLALALLNSYKRTFRSSRRGATTFWAIVQTTVVLGALIFGGYAVFNKLVQDKCTQGLEDHLNKALEHSGMSADVGFVKFVEGHGLKIDDFQLLCDGKELFTAYQAFVKAPLSITELVAGDIVPRSIEIRRAKLHIIRRADGSWNLEPLIELFRLKHFQDGPKPPIVFDDSVICVTDETFSPAIKREFVNVDLVVKPVIHQGRDLAQINGSFSGDSVSEIKFNAFLDPEKNSWRFDVAVKDATLSDRMVDLIPPTMRNVTNGLQSVSGKLNLTGFAEGDLELKQEPTFHFDVNIRQFSLDDQRLPMPIHRSEMVAAVNNTGIHVKQAHGQMGVGSFDVTYQQQGLIDRGDWQISGNLRKLKFDQKLRPWLPTECSKFCHDYSPDGFIDLELSASSTRGQMANNLEARLRGVSFLYNKFPFKINNCIGFVKCVNNDCTFDFKGFENENAIRFHGRAKNPGPNSTYIVNIEIEGKLPIDRKLISAARAQPKLYSTVSRFRPTGWITGTGRIEKSRPDQLKENRSMDVRLVQCNLQHEKFEYPIHDVNGLIKVRNNHYQFQQIRGSNGRASVACNGTWTESEGLALKILCKTVPINDQLRSALSANIRQVWNGFRPRGTIGILNVDLTVPSGTENANVSVVADMVESNYGASSDVTINPVWFPYRLENLTGRIEIGKGRVSLSDIKARHDRTWLVCRGNGSYGSGKWSVLVKDLMVGALKIDDSLIQAVPESIRSALRKLQFQGQLVVNGEIGIAGGGRTQNRLATNQDMSPGVHQAGFIQPVNGKNTELDWNLRFDMNQAKLNVGVPVDNVFGAVALTGRSAKTGSYCRGLLDLDSVTVEGIQIRHVKGPIRFENKKSTIGRLAAQNPASPDAQSVTGKLFGGVLVLDAQVQSDDPGQFFVQAVLDDADMSQVVDDLVPQVERANGTLHARIRLGGNQSGTKSFRGEGNVQLRNAEVYELPVVLSLLKILNIREVNRNAFDSANLDFTIQADEFDFHRIELIGDAISLLGQGKMGFNRIIDLDFYSVLGRNRIYIPLISEMYKASSREVLWINVNGNLANPKLHRRILPQLNESMKQLFKPPKDDELRNTK